MSYTSRERITHTIRPCVHVYLLIVQRSKKGEGLPRIKHGTWNMNMDMEHEHEHGHGHGHGTST